MFRSMPKDALTDLYKQTKRGEIKNQAVGHLRGRADLRAKAAVRRFWLLAVISGIALIVGAGVFCVWLLQTARNSGQSFSQVRNQALQSYAEERDE